MKRFRLIFMITYSLLATYLCTMISITTKDLIGFKSEASIGYSWLLSILAFPSVLPTIFIWKEILDLSQTLGFQFENASQKGIHFAVAFCGLLQWLIVFRIYESLKRKN